MPPWPEEIGVFLRLQGYSALEPVGAALRFARLADRSLLVIEPKPDGRLAVHSERLGTPCLLIRSNCHEQGLLTTILAQICLLDRTPR